MGLTVTKPPALALLVLVVAAGWAACPARSHEGGLVPERGASYDSLYLPPDTPRARFDADLRFMKDAGVTSVYVTANESDIRDRRKLAAATSAGHHLGLRVYLDAYLGGTFSGDEGGSAASYLAAHPDAEQVSRDGVRAGVPSVNDHGYQRYVAQEMTALLTTTGFDGVVLDEPTMATLPSRDRLKPGDYFPYDAASRAMFQAEHGYPMPGTETPDVVAFRGASMDTFIASVLHAVRAAKPRVRTILIVLPHEVIPGLQPSEDFAGTDDWASLASIPDLDVLETDPYWYAGDRWDWFVANVAALRSAVAGRRVVAGVWVQAFGMSGGYSAIARSLRYLAPLVPWLAVWVTDHDANADMAATWSEIASVYRARGAHTLTTR